MRFDELNEDNYVLFAIKHYDNPQAATKEDFFEDMRRLIYLKRLRSSKKSSLVTADGLS